MTIENQTFAPPPHPPPLLDDEQVHNLIIHGYIPITLPPRLSALYANLTDAATGFFDLDVNIKTTAYPQAHGTELGYYVVKDEKEYLTLRSKTTTGDVELEKLAQDTWQGTAILFTRALGDVSQKLGIPLHAWAPLLDGNMALPEQEKDKTPALLRLFRYFPNSGTAEKHVDNGLFTLCVGSGRGLQVSPRNGKENEWYDVEGPTLLAGRTLRMLSTNRVNAGMHRVCGNAHGRHSVVFTLRPSTRNHVDLVPFGGQGFADMSQVWKRMTGKLLNVNAHKHIREARRAERKTSE